MRWFDLILGGGLVHSTTALPRKSPVLEDRRYTSVSHGIEYDVFDHVHTSTSMAYIKNSGICETTPGVNQYSGYLSVGTNMHMWFWFFEARKAASTAPLALWLNGGPGCSSMIGLFQENGPCHFVNGSTKPTLNPYSWNEYANMIYVDQPIGTGFSYGQDDATSTVTAAPYVWKLLQAFYAAFPAYENRDFALFTESYGGHYGPEFADYFEEQNAKIEAGTLQGDKINLVALGINNGWIDATVSYKAYVEFAYNNTYRRLITETQYKRYIQAYEDKCAPALRKCPGLTGTVSDCLKADQICASLIETPIEDANDFGYYDVRAPRDDPNPPETYVKYLQDPQIMKAIGATHNYSECADAPGAKISRSGDGPRSFLNTLSEVVQSGINVLLWAGDADWICNWMGNVEVADLVSYAQASSFRTAQVKPYTVNGTSYGEYKRAGNLNWLRVFDAGHEVPFYQPEVSLQAFVQIVQKRPLAPT